MTDREKFQTALRLVAKEKHNKTFAELSTADATKVVSLVSEKYPALRAAFDKFVDGGSRDDDGVPVTTIVEVQHDPHPEPAAPVTPESRRQQAAREYGFTQDMTRSDPLCASMVDGLVRYQERHQARVDFEDELAAVGRKHGLDPGVHAQRLQIAKIMAAQGHPLVTGKSRFTEL